MPAGFDALETGKPLHGRWLFARNRSRLRPAPCLRIIQHGLYFIHKTAGMEAVADAVVYL